MIFAYKRVSTVDQKLDRQLSEIAIKFDKEFVDKASAKDKERPRLKVLLESVRSGDEIHVHSIDRLARNVQNLIEIVTELNQQGVTIIFHKESLKFEPESDSSMSKFMLTILGAVAEFEREIINERIREGVAIAKDKGKYKGRTANMRKAEKIRQLESEGCYTREQIADMVGCGVATVYRTLKKAKVA